MEKRRGEARAIEVAARRRVDAESEAIRERLSRFRELHRPAELERDCHTLGVELFSISMKGGFDPWINRIPTFEDPEVDALVQRLVRGTLSEKDIGPADPPFPCLAKQREHILRAYSQGLSQSAIWTLAVEVSPLAEVALTRRFLNGSHQERLIERLNELVLLAAENKRPDELSRATKLCELAKAMLGVPRMADDPFAKGGCRQLFAPRPSARGAAGAHHAAKSGAMPARSNTNKTVGKDH